MKLSFVEICGFRGYQKPVRIDFAPRFTIIDGRNGVGKSTVFDAIEFAITGELSKYSGAKSAGETVADYLWWAGDGPPPPDRYVEVGFVKEGREFSIRRSQLGDVNEDVLKELAKGLCDASIAPASPLAQICSTSIIRDEHITTLSLDMKETDRYALLREALGANDAQKWIERAAELVSTAKKRTAVAQQEVAIANTDVAMQSRRLDEVRTTLGTDSMISEAARRLQSFANVSSAPDQLAAPARERVISVRGEIDAVQVVLSEWQNTEAAKAAVPDAERSIADAQTKLTLAKSALDALPADDELVPTTKLASDARDLIALVSLGRKLGLHNDSCPLCTKGQTHDEFSTALATTEALAHQLSERAARAAELQRERDKLSAGVEDASRAVKAAEDALSVSNSRIAVAMTRRKVVGVAETESEDQVRARLVELVRDVEAAERDLRVLDTLRLSETLQRSQRAEVDAKSKLAKAQDRYGRARKVEAATEALHDAARRAASETLDRRLERVLPLMSELYRRLRPHPFWSDIEYSIRGDVRRFLKLQVGADLNPQFLFSSGQRRATGLAFLLSVNLSLAWSHWKTILLDDPVQHVDDFRSVHLAELLAQLVVDGRQIICAVEDAALADLLGRRLPVDAVAAGKRVTLGPDTDGAVSKQSERPLAPFAPRTVTSMSKLAAG